MSTTTILSFSLLAAAMRIIKQICIPSLLFLALYARGATLARSGADVSTQVNHDKVAADFVGKVLPLL